MIQLYNTTRLFGDIFDSNDTEPNSVYDADRLETAFNVYVRYRFQSRRRQ